MNKLTNKEMDDALKRIENEIYFASKNAFNIEDTRASNAIHSLIRAVEELSRIIEVEYRGKTKIGS